ncbi:DUF2637 domain-containing protein [Streptomyces koyangensis]|uniref:DUF2637 domain-containing protein n=1 Tax=Streptomyces koyangensis TaxID=188770 RepID=A0A385DHP4_9ACTN|nr:DUF2637 domain-containing protein [Streptomyces koyangensis]
MTTTIEPPFTVPASFDSPPASGARSDPSATSLAPSPTRAEPSGTFSEEQPTGSVEVPRKVKVALGIASILGGTVMGAIGFYLSFGNLSQAGHTVFGFSESDAPYFAVGVDVAIVTCLVLDLFMATIRTSWPLLRLLAHGMTAASIYFNAAAHGKITENWDKAASHGLMPVLFVIGVEAGRRILVHQAALPADHDTIPAHRWVLAGRQTWRIFKQMKLWDEPYSEVVARQRHRAVFNAWTEYKAEVAKAGLEEGSEEALARLPKKLEPFGMTVDEALALPDEMAREELRRQQEQEKRDRELELEKERANHEAEKERLAHRKEMAALTADLSATEGVAGAQARGAVVEAEAETERRAAEAARLAAEQERRVAEAAAARTAALAKSETGKAEAVEAERRAAEAKVKALEAERRVAEEEARAAEAAAAKTAALAKTETENAEALEAERRAAEAKAEALEAERRVAEEEARVAEAAAAKTAALAKTETGKAEAAEAEKRVAEAKAEAAEAEKRAAEAREAAAQSLRRAVEAEDFADLTQRQRRVRIAARLLLTAGDREVTNQEVADAIGVKSPGTASEHRAEAVALIQGGYPEVDSEVPSRN